MQPVNAVFSRFHGRTVKFGCLPPRAPIKRMLREYLTTVPLPPPPPSTNYRADAGPSLIQMFVNGLLGCCVISGRYHNIGLWTGGAFIASDAQVIRDYSAITGYDPGNPATDRGTDPVAALEWYAANDAADGSRIAGAVGFDGARVATPAGLDQLKQAIDLFIGGGWLTYCLPDAWVNPLPSSNGFVWDVAGPADPSNGHCTAILDYGPQGVVIDTWGMWGTVTWAAVAAYCTAAAGGLVYIMLTPDQVAAATLKAPNGLDWPQLVADFPALGGTSSIVPVTVSPGPVPVIPGPVIPPPEPASTMAYFGLDVTNKLASVPEGWSCFTGIYPEQATIHLGNRGFSVPKGYRLAPV
jgi:hypothetical protein